MGIQLVGGADLSASIQTRSCRQKFAHIYIPNPNQGLQCMGSAKRLHNIIGGKLAVEIEKRKTKMEKIVPNTDRRHPRIYPLAVS